MKNKHKLRIYTHLYFDEVRVCVALLNKNNHHIDSFDFEPSTGKIRFYGTNKSYYVDRVPETKCKQWGIDNFNELMNLYVTL